MISVDFFVTVCRNCGMDWIKKIKAARTNGATLAEIGAAIGLAASTVSDIESGRTKQPKGMAAVRLANLDPKTLQPETQEPRARRIDTPEAVERTLRVARAVPEAAPAHDEQAPDVEADDQVEPSELDMVEPDADTTDYDPDIDRIGPLDEVA